MLHISSTKPRLYLLLSLLLPITAISSASPPPINSLQPPSDDATALLAFKSKADPNNNLPSYSQNTTIHFCRWQGVKCQQQTHKVLRLLLQNVHLGGIFAPNTLTRLDQLRVLSLQNTSLAGPIPDLSKLSNLKTLFLDHNTFSGAFPPSLISLHRLRTLDFSHNNLTGPIPPKLTSLDRLIYLRLDSNRLNGSIPPLNQSALFTFNVSYNNFTGAIPVTPALIRSGLSSFLSNPSLCGEIIHKECRPGPPFFTPSPAEAEATAPSEMALGQSEELHGVNLTQPGGKTREHKRAAVIIGFSSGAVVLIGSLFCFAMAARRQKVNQEESTAVTSSDHLGGARIAEATAVMQIDLQESELEEKVKRAQQEMHVGKSGSLVFCAGESQLYSLEQLMRASAELLGRGSMGTTYKAVLDSRLIVCVKRLDAGKLAVTSKDVFERHMESVGGLRHPNLVPLRAYFQANEERLLIYDYQPNGSLFSLIHGSKSTRAKPLHWTSCLKIAEDVAQGLSYIHQAWRLVHGNLKSSNVLLGPDFEACVVDYCLALLVVNNNTSPADADPDVLPYKAPEIRNSSSNHQLTSKSDVYAFGILLLELLTGKLPSQLPTLVPNDMVDWFRSTRKEHENSGTVEDNRLELLLEVAIACSLSSPDQRPTMWQVLKMIQEIKESVLPDDGELLDLHNDVMS